MNSQDGVLEELGLGSCRSTWVPCSLVVRLGQPLEGLDLLQDKLLKVSSSYQQVVIFLNTPFGLVIILMKQTQIKTLNKNKLNV